MARPEDDIIIAGYFMISAGQATRILQVMQNNLEFISGQTRSHTYVTLLHPLSSLTPNKLKLNISTYGASIVLRRHGIENSEMLNKNSFKIDCIAM